MFCTLPKRNITLDTGVPYGTIGASCWTRQRGVTMPPKDASIEGKAFYDTLDSPNPGRQEKLSSQETPCNSVSAKQLPEQLQPPPLPDDATGAVDQSSADPQCTVDFVPASGIDESTAPPKYDTSMSGEGGREADDLQSARTIAHEIQNGGAAAQRCRRKAPYRAGSYRRMCREKHSLCQVTRFWTC